MAPSSRRRSLLLALSCGLLCACGSDGPEPITRADAGDMDATETSGPIIVGPEDRTPSDLMAGEGIEGCPAWTPSPTIAVCTATYLGGMGADRFAGVAIGPDGSIYVAANLPGLTVNYGPNPLELLNGGAGVVVRLDPTGRMIVGWTRLGNELFALDVAASTGDVIVSGGFGLASLTPEIDALNWSVPADASERIDVTPEGGVALVSSKNVRVVDPEGSTLVTFMVDADHVEDIAYDSAREHILAAGFEQVASNLQRPYVRAYDLSGAIVWTAWDWPSGVASGYGSDTRAYAVSVGADGFVYMAGEAHGGETVFKLDPQNPEVRVEAVAHDDYSKTFNLNGSAPIGYFARLDPDTGAWRAGQFVVTRLSSGKGNAARLRHIEARADGTVLIGGQSACCIKEGAEVRVAGTAPMPEYAGGAFVMATDPSMTRRFLWTTFAASATKMSLDGIAFRGEAIAVIQRHEADGAMGLVGRAITHEALQPERNGGASEAYLTVLPAPAE